MCERTEFSVGALRRSTLTEFGLVLLYVVETFNVTVRQPAVFELSALFLLMLLADESLINPIGPSTVNLCVEVLTLLRLMSANDLAR